MFQTYLRSGAIPFCLLPPQKNRKEKLFLNKTYGLKTGDIDTYKLVEKYFFETLVRLHREKYQKVAELNEVKDDSIDQGRAYVEAYVDYTHTIEAIHDIIEHGGGHAGH